MKANFNINDKIKIVNHENSRYIGKEGTIKSVITIFENHAEAIKAINNGFKGAHTIKTEYNDNTTGFYQIVLNGYKTSLKGYACDNDIIKLPYDE